MKQIKCWLTRHHWLLQGEQTRTLYEDNLLPRDSWYYYECQVCGKIERQNIINLANMPVESEGSAR